MIDEVIKYIDKANPWLKSQGFCFMREFNEGLLLPAKKKGNEFEMVQNFDKLQEFSYWRVIAPVDVVRIDNNYSVKKLYTLSYPCKLVMCKAGEKSEDAQALSVIAQLNDIKKINREEINVYNIFIDFKNYDINQATVLKDEFGENFQINDKFNFVAFNITLTITVDSDCLQLC